MNRSEIGDEFSSEIYFGGPDQPPGSLRDVLAAHIAAVPSGGSIDWVTYYFRDPWLAEALIGVFGIRYLKHVNVLQDIDYYNFYWL